MSAAIPHLNIIIERAYMLLRAAEKVDVGQSLTDELTELGAKMNDLGDIVMYGMAVGGVPLSQIAAVNMRHESFTQRDIESGRVAFQKRQIQPARTTMPRFDTQPQQVHQRVTQDMINANMSVPIITLALSSRVTNIYTSQGIMTVGLLISQRVSQLREIPKLGLKGVRETTDKLLRRGFWLHE